MNKVLHVDKIFGDKESGCFGALLKDAPVEQSPDFDKVICPECCHQFRAIPVSVQKLMIEAGFIPPFTAAPDPQCPNCGLFTCECDDADQKDYIRKLTALKLEHSKQVEGLRDDIEELKEYHQQLIAELQRERDRTDRADAARRKAELDFNACRDALDKSHEELDMLRRQVRELRHERDSRDDLLEQCRSSVKFDLITYEQKSLAYMKLGPEGVTNHLVAEAEANRLHKLLLDMEAILAEVQGNE